MELSNMKETIRFTIKQDGTVIEQVEGVYGSNCENLTSNIEEKLGEVYFKESTSDYYNKSKIVETQNVSL
tara:strand:+ start:99 stop:308 length:210 start_codon:yes stop_codon:yes gene_type:complete